MEINRQKILEKVGIAPIETVTQIKKDMKLRNTQAVGLGVAAAFEAGVIVTMAIMGKNKCKPQCQISSAAKYCQPTPTETTEDFCEQEAY